MSDLVLTSTGHKTHIRSTQFEDETMCHKRVYSDCLDAPAQRGEWFFCEVCERMEDNLKRNGERG